MSSSEKIIPGDVITAMGMSFTVWSILYQDHCGGTYDVEFIDDQDRYHHWKQDQDGGQVTRSGEPGTYFRETSGTCGRGVIACIKPRRQRNGYTANVIYRGGPKIFLGSHSTFDGAMNEIYRYSATHRYHWKEM